MENLVKAKEADSKDNILSTYLIMERINPPHVEAVMMKNGNLRLVNSLSEIGVYSYILFDNKRSGKEGLRCEDFKYHETIGTLMRTKESHFNEGGVNAGFAVIDTPFLVP